MYRPMQRLLIPGAKAVGDHYPRACSKSGKKADDRIDNIVRGAHCRKRRLADKISYYNAVHCIIKLLKQISDQKGQRKQDQMHPDITLRHISCLCLGMTHVLLFLSFFVTLPYILLKAIYFNYTPLYCL